MILIHKMHNVFFSKGTKKVLKYIFATNKSEVETWNESSLNVMSILRFSLAPSLIIFRTNCLMARLFGINYTHEFPTARRSNPFLNFYLPCCVNLYLFIKLNSNTHKENVSFSVNNIWIIII